MKIKISFRDDELLKRGGVVYKELSDAELATMGRFAIAMTRSGFSQQGVASLFLLAYHLKDPMDGSRMFGGAEAVGCLEDKDWDEFPTVVLHTTTTTTAHEALPAATSDVAHEASVYTYIAASLLRLFTKSEENYIKAHTHIVQGYQRFYRVPCKVLLPPPHVDALKSLTHYFSRGDVYKNSLFRFLYITGNNTKTPALRKFLYEIHLANTGMHIVSIFARLCAVLNCAPSILLSAINSPEYERQISALIEMLKLVTSDSPEYSRKMWKFGRIFDDAFMCHLQTKSCPSLTYILASALKSVAENSNENILNIHQLGDVSAEKRRIYDAIAKTIVKMVSNFNENSAAPPPDKI